MVPIIDKELCNRWYNDSIKAGMLCAGYQYGGIDACKVQNDSIKQGLSWKAHQSEPLRIICYTKFITCNKKYVKKWNGIKSMISYSL